ncbi:NADPH-dependent FMN reductase [Desulfonema limicola]|uniref:NADPH-dependent FMN reductase n=1 Tax=Desulfonema limicola TaxID=45656 RepID=A0A975BAT3_9BACT|nr:flavodoxin family protein [Desulfonema limicola]QTA81880.1 NADPH-dependent FMN reductase [Desulfonema limicola]
MKKILGIISSPRNLGNSEIMVKEISRNISLPHELQLLRLSDFNILPCTGCYMCLIKNKGCVLKDDFNMLAERILEADALIVAAPTYFLGANSCLKRLTDRGLALYPHAEKLWGKPAVGIGIAGIPGKEGYTLLGIENFIKLILADMKQAGIIYGALPGEIFLNNENRETAKELASALFEPAPEKAPCSCPLCGGKTFRFLKENRIQCMLCSNIGSMTLKDNIPCFDIQKGEHELFLSLEEVIEHRKWLVSMKSRFLQHKDELKKISLDYRNYGEWIKP